jgi:hypothetical protein
LQTKKKLEVLLDGVAIGVKKKRTERKKNIIILSFAI